MLHPSRTHQRLHGALLPVVPEPLPGAGELLRVLETDGAWRWAALATTFPPPHRPQETRKGGKGGGGRCWLFTTKFLAGLNLIQYVDQLWACLGGQPVSHQFCTWHRSFNFQLPKAVRNRRFPEWGTMSDCPPFASGYSPSHGHLPTNLAGRSFQTYVLH